MTNLRCLDPLLAPFLPFWARVEAVRGSGGDWKVAVVQQDGVMTHSRRWAAEDLFISHDLINAVLRV